MPTTIEMTHGALSSVDYFRAKLQFEATPYGVSNAKNKEDFVLLDVRDRESFEKEHIPGAYNIPGNDLPKRMSHLPKHKVVVTYCWGRDCSLAPRAALQLAEHGYRVREMSGGIAAWKDAGYELEGSEVPAVEASV